MEIMLAAISAGGLVGVSNQYLCLLLIALAAQGGWFKLPPGMQEIMGSWWFIGLVALFWLLTVLPAYSSLLLPGLMNTVNTFTNFLSGFVVPASSIILSLASAGYISELDPEMQQMLYTLRMFNPEGGIGATGWAVAGGGALAGSTLTFMKFLTKPALSLATGTAGTVSAPIYTTLENIASVVLMGLLYILLNTNPWLLVILFLIVAAITLALLIYGLYLLWKLGKGVGQLIRLLQNNPKAGWAIVLEFFVWGTGWLIWQRTTRGAVMIVAWLIFGFLWWVFLGIASLLPLLLLLYIPLSLMTFTLIGVLSARGLMRTLDIPDEDLPPDMLGGLPEMGLA